MKDRREDRDDPGDAASPWATDEIAAGSAPEFDWEQPNEPADDDSEASPDTGTRNRVLIAIGCVVALVVAASVLWPRSDDPTDTADGDDSPATTLDTLPSVESEATDAGSGTDGSTDTADEADDEADGEILSGAPPAPDGDVSSIELPDPVAANAEPTELVLVSGDDIVTVSLPSGSVRRSAGSVGVGNSGGVMVAPDAVAWFSGQGVTIIPRIGPPLGVDIGTGSNGGGYVMDWITDESGSTVFLVDTFNGDENQQFTVDIAGNVDPYEPDRSRFDTFAFFGGLRSGTGDDIVNDAGGVYRLGIDDEVERISTGFALAANDGFVLVRECDEALECSYTVIDLATGERRASPATTEQLGGSYGFDLSPDGTATIANDAERDGRRLVDLVEGTIVAEVGNTSFSDRNTQWAADSSGVFQLVDSDAGITFVDRSTGEEVEFATELGRFTSLGVRIPDAELDSFGNVVATRPFTFTVAPSEPIGLDVVVLGELGSMAHLDLDGAVASVWSVPPVAGTVTPDLVASGSKVFVVPSGGRRSFVSEFGSSEALGNATDALTGSPRFPGPGPGLVWTPRDGRADGVDHRVFRIDDTVELVEDSVTLPNSELLGDDGNGRLVARVGGDVFVVGVGDTVKLTDGDLLALGANHALVRTCDDALACTVERVQRVTGEDLDDGQRSPEIDGVLVDAQPVDEPDRAPQLGATMSPDGEVALVRSAPVGSTAQWLLVDFATGDRFAVPSPADGQPIIWNDDSSAAVYLGDDGVHVIERSARRAITLQGLGEVRALTAVEPTFAA